MDSKLTVLRTDGPAAFAFLVDRYGFSGPERIDEGLRYSRPGVDVEITVWNWNSESGFSTRLWRHAADGRRSSTGLDDLYVELGHGPAQDVGATMTSGHTVRKRIREHATALTVVLADPAFGAS